MKKILTCSRLLLIPALLLWSIQAQAIIMLSPPGDASTSTNSNLTTLDQINTAFGTAYTGLDLLWKGETDFGAAGQGGALIDSYLWNVATPANGGTIDYVAGETAASCPTCFLIVKDGRANPGQYLFDLGAWNGMEQISLSGFWPTKTDAISNVAIWGGKVSVPEPVSLALLGLGLLGLAFSQRKNQA